MKIAFLGVRVPGHLNPMTTLARKLKARGHDVVFLSMPDTERFVRAAELPFIPFCENDFPVGSLAKSMAALSKLQGQAALELVIKSVAILWNRHSEICRERCGTRTRMRWSLMKSSGAWELFRCILACLTSMSRTLSPLIFQGILQYAHLTGKMRRPRRHWPEIRQVCAAYCKRVQKIEI